MTGRISCDSGQHETLAEEFLKCKLSIFTKLGEYDKELEGIKTRVDELEAGHLEFRHTLGRHEEQRITNHTKLTSQVEALHKRFDKHDEQEMMKYDKINDSILLMNNTVGSLIEKIDKIASDTDANSEYISKHEAEIEKEEYAKKKLEEADAPRKEVWHKVKMTAVSVITLAILGVLGKFLWLGINIDELVTEAKQAQEKPR